MKESCLMYSQSNGGPKGISQLTTVAIMFFMVIGLNSTLTCQTEVDSFDLWFAYNLGDWYAFGDLHSQGAELQDVRPRCDLSVLASDRIAIIDSVSCPCLQSRYLLILLGYDESNRTSSLLRWIVQDKITFRRTLFENSAQLEQYVRNDYWRESVTDSVGARHCAVALATLLSPVLPQFFPERRGQLLPIFGAIWGRSLWSEVLVNNELAETIGSAAIFGADVDKIGRFAEELPFPVAVNDTADSLAGSVYSVCRNVNTYSTRFLSWSPRRSAFLIWNIDLSADSIEKWHWDEISLPTAGVTCGYW